MVNAVVYVRPENYRVTAARCLEYCTERRYNVVGLVQGDWQAAIRMVRDGLATVVVVSANDQLDPEREPRVEVVPKRRPRRSSPSAGAYAGRRITPNDSGAYQVTPPLPPASVQRNAFRA